MSVITLTPPLLQSASRQLARRVVDAGFDPQLIIGILNGGAQVARLMREELPPEAQYCEVRITRPSTSQKEQTSVHRLMQLMPLWLCDVLREAESYFTALRGSSVQERWGDVVLPPEAETLLSASCNVLIVDDAIDSGATVRKVREQLLARFPSAVLRVAVITVTTSHPACDADYCLYHNHTLCRFPWSNDYREKR